MPPRAWVYWPKAVTPRRRLAVLTLALVGALTAGCATPAPVADTPTQTPTLEVSPTPTPTPSATPEAGPVRAFDADCAQMLTTDQRDAILGSGSITPDCTELSQAIALEELIGPYLHGYWEGSEQPEEVLFAAAGVARACPVFSDSARVDPASAKSVIMTPQIAPPAWAGSGNSFVWTRRAHPSPSRSREPEDLELDAQILGRIITALSS